MLPLVLISFASCTFKLEDSPPFDLKNDTYTGTLSDYLVNADVPQFTFEGYTLNATLKDPAIDFKFVFDINN